ncbi:MAG: HK97 family phage prohead protease [Gammaproteobacteria bacterium]|nr:HK97 family phage prohead protease [Gammaproteobacteria bacterium]
MKKIEFRTALTDNGKTVKGYAAVFNEPTNAVGFTEVIRHGAFTRSLQTGNNIRALYQHNDNLLLGTTQANTLRLREDNHGLAFELDLPNTTAGRDVLELVKRGDISGCSFGFYIREERNKNDIRELLDVDLIEITLTANPAYRQTSIGVRSTNNTRWLETC